MHYHPGRDPSLLVFRIAVIGILTALASAGCTSMAALSNLDVTECRTSFTSQLASILSAQGESEVDADRLAENTADALSSGRYGPRPFRVAAPSGTDYAFFLQRKGDTCLLRQYGRRKGFLSYTNNLTYIATKPLQSCMCTE